MAGSVVHPKEPWHLRYFAGDDIPAAVLAYERTLDGPRPAPTPDPDPTGDQMVLIHCTAIDQRYALMPDGLVRLTEAEFNQLLLGGGRQQIVPTTALLDKLVKGKRVVSFVDAPTLGG
jgi:hypothetical protein